MTTIINTPGNTEDSGIAIIIGVLVAIIVITLFFLYGLPAIRGTSPQSSNSTVDINIKPVSDSTK